MSEAIEGDDSAPANAIIAEQGCYFPGGPPTNPYYHHRGSLANGEYSEDYPRWHEHGNSFNEAVGVVHFAGRDAQTYHLPFAHYDQKPMRQLNEQVQYEVQYVGGHDHYHPSARTYSTTNEAYPTAASYGQDGQYWDSGVFTEPAADRSGPIDNITAASQEKPAPTVDAVYKSQPYAKLIYLALLSVPGHKMVLKDIYKWFNENTDKAQTGSSGWQNSIRHNLSMNIAFQKEEARDPTNQGKKNYVWALSKDALEKGGVESTTRFRKPVSRKVSQTQPPYRVAKSSSISKPKPLLHSFYQLPMRNAFWNGEALGAGHGFEAKESLNPYFQQPAWQGPTYQDSRRPTMYARGGQQAAYQPLQQEERKQIPAYGNHDPDAHEAQFTYPLHGVADYTETIKREATDTAYPGEIAAVERISPCPSMTVTNSSFGYQDLSDEERYHFFHSPELHAITKYPSEQYYDRLQAWRMIS